MALTPEEAATLARLNSAYDRLIAGGTPNLIQEGQSKTQFGDGDPVALKARIDQLTAKAASPTGRTRGALTFRIGS